MVSMTTPLAAVVRIEQEMSRDFELGRAIGAYFELRARVKDPSVPFRVVVDCVSEVTGEIDVRLRAVRLVERLIALGLLRPYRLVADTLEFTELAKLLAERQVARIPAPSPAPPTASPTRSWPAQPKTRNRPAKASRSQELSASAQEALLDLVDLADEAGDLPRQLSLHLYRLWQERHSPLLPRDLRGMFNIVQQLVCRDLVVREHDAAPYRLTAAGRSAASAIKAHRRSSAVSDTGPSRTSDG